ncbi:MAG: hypothetical protein O7H41_21225 [Planctomycetota bacterium]|nr:hypothetical protein [Planctomycetota bacterium]
MKPDDKPPDQPDEFERGSEPSEGLGDIDADLAVLMPRPDETDTGLEIMRRETKSSEKGKGGPSSARPAAQKTPVPVRPPPPPPPPPKAAPPPAPTPRPQAPPPPEPGPEAAGGFDFHPEKEPEGGPDRHRIQKEGFHDDIPSSSEGEKKFGGPKRRKVATVKRVKARPAQKKPAAPASPPVSSQAGPAEPPPPDEPIKAAFPKGLPEGLGEISDAATQRIPGHQRFSDLPDDESPKSEAEVDDREFLELFAVDESSPVSPPDQKVELSEEPASPAEAEPEDKPEVIEIVEPASPAEEPESLPKAELQDRPEVIEIVEPAETPTPPAKGEAELEIDAFPVTGNAMTQPIGSTDPKDKPISAYSTEEIPIPPPVDPQDVASEPDTILDQEFREFMGGEAEPGEPKVPLRPSTDPTESVREYKTAESRDLDTPYSKEELENLFAEEAPPTPPWEKKKSRRKARSSRRARSRRATSSGKLLLLVVLLGGVLGVAHLPNVSKRIQPFVAKQIVTLGLQKYFPVYVKTPDAKDAEDAGVLPGKVDPGDTKKGPPNEDPAKPPREDPVRPPKEDPPELPPPVNVDPALKAFLDEAMRSEKLGVPILSTRGGPR